MSVEGISTYLLCFDCSEAKNKHTPLTVAAYNGRSAVIEALVKRGADVNARCVFAENLMMQYNVFETFAS